MAAQDPLQYTPRESPQPASRGFKFNLGAKSHKINEMFAHDNAQSLPTQPDEDVLDFQVRAAPTNANVIKPSAHTKYTPQFVQPAQPLRPTSPMYTPSQLAQLSHPPPEINQTHQSHVVKSQLNEMASQLEESKRRLIVMQRKHDQERKTTAETFRSMQDTIESHKRQAEQAKHELMQLQTTITTNKSAEQSALVARDSQLFEMRQAYTQQLNAMRDSHLESLRTEREKMTQASNEISKLNMEKDLLAQQNLNLESSLQTLKVENDNLRPPIIAEPLVPPACDHEVINSQVCISNGQMTIGSMMSNDTIKSALSKDLSAVVMNAFKRRQKHGLVSDVVVNA